MELMNNINSLNRVSAPRRDFERASSKKPSGLTVTRVRDFAGFMKLIAQYDLWDEMEAELKSQGCTKFFISVKPMRAIGSALKKKASIGDLPADTPALSACIQSCDPPPSPNKTSQPMKPGTSEGQTGDAGAPGSKDKPQ